MNPEQFGLTSETTQALSGSIFAAGLREYLRPAKSITKRVCGAALCIGGGWLFGDEVSANFPVIHPGLQVSACVAGVLCIGVAEGLLKAVERFDLLAFFKKGQA